MNVKKHCDVCEHETHQSGFANHLRTNSHSDKRVERKKFDVGKAVFDSNGYQRLWLSAKYIVNLNKRTKHTIKGETGKKDVDKESEDHFRTRIHVTAL